MGDECCDARSIGGVADRIRSSLGTSSVVESLVVANSGSKDASANSQVYASFFGNAIEQADAACAHLLERYGGESINMVGFSQGGQLLRAVVERCEGLNVNNLVSLGGQHQGVSTVPGCASSHGDSIFCRSMQQLVNYGVYTSFVQARSIQAQYVKDPYRLDAYASKSIFLADINNEKAGAKVNTDYKRRLLRINKLVLFRFRDDVTVVPRDSSWFSFDNGTAVVPMEQTDLYRDDTIGLRALNERGDVLRLECPGAHMQFTLDWFDDSVTKAFLV